MQLAAVADEVSAAAREFTTARAERDAAADQQRQLRADLQKVGHLWSMQHAESSNAVVAHQLLMQLTATRHEGGQFVRGRKKIGCNRRWQALWRRQAACLCRCSSDWACTRAHGRGSCGGAVICSSRAVCSPLLIIVACSCHCSPAPSTLQLPSWPAWSWRPSPAASSALCGAM